MDNSALVAILAGSMISLVICLAILVVFLIAHWKLFTKAGEPGWKSLIPYYNIYTLFKIVWKTSVFWISMILVVVAYIALIASIFMQSDGILIGVTILVMIIAIIETIFGLILVHKLSKAFGHGIGFTLGLLFASPIFFLILAFGSSEYQGPQ